MTRPLGGELKAVQATELPAVKAHAVRAAFGSDGSRRHHEAISDITRQ